MTKVASSSYEMVANAVVERLKEWAKGKNLPKDVWDLPKNCPLWKEGLSLFQASWCLSQVKLGSKEEKRGSSCGEAEEGVKG